MHQPRIESITYAKGIHPELSDALPRATAMLGLPEVLLDLQSVKFRPREASFVEASYPAISAKFAYAIKNSPQEKHLLEGRCSQVLHADISFNEPIDFIQEIRIEGTDVKILAYSLLDLVAEKYRAILQQAVRNRARRQDIFDLNFLILDGRLHPIDPKQLLQTFVKKCNSRNIKPNKNSLDDPNVKKKSQQNWESLKSEVEILPDFEEAYLTVSKFYRSLPW
ncbi:nucleotidyl transferase AbiEii/AbiGii toxin family protein [Erythrobacter sp. MTPC3]|uniref:nucleotidyl transferase AbiEii/AbiGii toxin family protein n=1 Tax=Erythrobacter sp. MTPC3 TaxID=3056564 RepID=UPI0036F2B07D